MRFVLALLLLSACLPSLAQSPAARRHWNWSEGVNPGVDVVGGPLRFSGRFSAWTLLGEPVVNCTARMERAAGLQVEVGQGRDARFESVGDGELEVYGLVVAAMMDEPGAPTWNGRSSAKLVVFCDAGIVAQAGRDGFNVAGSPSWDALFCATLDTAVRFGGRDEDAVDACAAVGGRWLPAAEARAVFRRGLDFREFAVHDLRLNASATVRRVEKARWRARSAALQRERAGALLDRLRDGTVEGSRRVTEAMRRLGQLPDPPDAESLRRFGRTLAALESQWPDQPARRAAWEARERELVTAQIERMQAIDREVRREDAALANYRRDLEALAAQAPPAPDPLADAMAFEAKAFRDGDLHGLQTPEGEVLVPPTFHGVCGTYRGLACVRDRAGRRALVDANGETYLDFQDASIRLDGQSLACGNSVVLERTQVGRRGADFAIYSLSERRFLSEWMPGLSLEAAGDCAAGWRLIESEQEVERTCSRVTTRENYLVLGHDGQVQARGQHRLRVDPNICLRMGAAPAGAAGRPRRGLGQAQRPGTRQQLAVPLTVMVPAVVFRPEQNAPSGLPALVRNSPLMAQSAWLKPGVLQPAPISV